MTHDLLQKRYNVSVLQVEGGYQLLHLLYEISWIPLEITLRKHIWYCCGILSKTGKDRLLFDGIRDQNTANRIRVRVGTTQDALFIESNRGEYSNLKERMQGLADPGW